MPLLPNNGKRPENRIGKYIDCPFSQTSDANEQNLIAFRHDLEIRCVKDAFYLTRKQVCYAMMGSEITIPELPEEAYAAFAGYMRRSWKVNLFVMEGRVFDAEVADLKGIVRSFAGGLREQRIKFPIFTDSDTRTLCANVKIAGWVYSPPV